MERIKPSFDVLLQTGLHRGLYGHNLHEKHRPLTSKRLHEGIDNVGRRGQDHRSHGYGVAQADASESWHAEDRYSKPSTIHGDIEKRKIFEREHDRGARRMTDFRDLSPTRHSGRAVGARSKMKADDSLSAMVMRASHLSTDDLDDSPSWSTYATLPRSKPYRHYPGASVISVEELPQPQRGTYRVVTETVTAGDDDRAWNTGDSDRWRLSPEQSDGPHLSVRPISVHDDQLMAYLRQTKSTADDFTLNALLAKSNASKHEHHRQQHYVGASTGSEYTVDDEMGQLHRFLDNPFTGRKYERNLPKKQVRLCRVDTTMQYYGCMQAACRSLHAGCIRAYLSSIVCR